MIQEKKWIIRGVQANYLYLFISSMLALVLTPILVRYLGQAAYGLWAAFGSVIGYFGLLNFGMGTATTKYTAEYIAVNMHRTSLVSCFGIELTQRSDQPKAFV